MPRPEVGQKDRETMLLSQSHSCQDPADRFTGRILVAGGVRWTIGEPLWTGSSGDVDPLAWTEYEITPPDSAVVWISVGKTRRKILSKAAITYGEVIRATRSVDGEAPAGEWEISRVGEWWAAPGQIED